MTISRKTKLGKTTIANRKPAIDATFETLDQKGFSNCGTNPNDYVWIGVITKRGWDIHLARNLSADPSRCRLFLSWRVEEWNYKTRQFETVGYGSICLKDAAQKRLYAAETEKLSQLKDISVTWSRCN
jgi:hypothetical protein